MKKTKKLKLNKHLQAYKKYSADPAFYAYRSDWNHGPTAYLFFKSASKLLYYFLKEYIYYLKDESIELGEFTALVGTENHQRTFNHLEATIAAIEPIGLHNYKIKKKISFFKCYISGLPSLATAFYYCFLKRGKYKVMVAKTLNFFVVANGGFDVDISASSKRKTFFIFSEYSAYTNKIIESLKKKGFRIIYLPHARMPKRHRPFLSDIVFLDKSNETNADYVSDNIHFIDKLDEILLWGCGEASKPRAPSVLICLNVFDSLKTASSIIQYVSTIFDNNVISIRFHPAEKFRTLKSVLLKIISRKNLTIDVSALSESLSPGTLVIAGKSGVLADAVSRGLRAYSWISTEEICDYFSLRPGSILPLDSLAANHLNEPPNDLASDLHLEDSELKENFRKLAII